MSEDMQEASENWKKEGTKISSIGTQTGQALTCWISQSKTMRYYICVVLSP